MPLDIPRKVDRMALFTKLDSFVRFKDLFSYRGLSDSIGIVNESRLILSKCLVLSKMSTVFADKAGF